MPNLKLEASHPALVKALGGNVKPIPASNKPSKVKASGRTVTPDRNAGPKGNLDISEAPKPLGWRVLPPAKQNPKTVARMVMGEQGNGKRGL